MEPMQILKIFARLENDLSTFYGKLKNVSMLREFMETFESMEKHSQAHSDRILSKYKAFKIPELKVDPLIILHNNVKENFMNEIKNEGNVLFVLKKLAQAEEQIGKIYKSIAVHYKHNAERYQFLADEIDQIGDEEFLHRDHILKEMERQSQRQSAAAEQAPKERFSLDDHRKLKTMMETARRKIDDLKLTSPEKRKIDQELTNMEKALENSFSEIKESCKKVEEVLNIQKSGKEIDDLTEKIRQVRLQY